MNLRLVTSQPTVSSSSSPFIRLFGPLELATGAQLPIAAKPRKLLVILALAAGDMLSSDVLTEELWGNDAPKSARITIQTYIYKLRKVQGLRQRIMTFSEGYVLQLSRGEVDIFNFIESIKAAEAYMNNGQLGEAQQSLAMAYSLLRGPFLEGVDKSSPKLMRGSEWIDDYVRKMSIIRFKIALKLGRHVEILEDLKAMWRESPVSEDLAWLTMAALARAGRRAEATAIYQETRWALREKLGLDVSPQLGTVLRLILENEPLPPSMITLQSEEYPFD
ncbi:MAG TPA: BTAD domain-containing putative transcriptional regulator [Candidatus Saccharimonadales bacterium]